MASCARYALDTRRVDGIVAGIRLRGDTHLQRDRARLEAVAARHDTPEHTDSATPRVLRKDDAAGSADSPLPLLVPVSRAATLLGISRAGAYRLVASDQLPTRRMGGRIYVLTSALLRELSG